MKIFSPSFENNESMPIRYTCDSRNINPSLVIKDVPENTQSLVLIVDDPDAPSKAWTHWTVWNIDPRIGRIEEGSVPEGAIEGGTDFGVIGYGGPCPPSGEHHYYFRLYALDCVLDLKSGAPRDQLDEAMTGYVIDDAELMGLYSRSREFGNKKF
ncbi:MAG: YbhB/YbcL family Raf kinase inhibitor-like protein [Patescibacteria group bacterium]|nr:YbhB/YbcL family Raf kinase inhibitor-like protein [Patescibacteria group bacterium]